MADRVSRHQRDRDDLAAVTVLTVFLCLYNNVVGAQRWHRRRYVPANLAMTALLLALARWRGLTPGELGLASTSAPGGVRVGGALGGAVVLALTVAAASPATRPWLRDARVVGLSWPAVAFHAAVRVPVGTVLWEETAFRSVLFAALARVMPTGPAVAASSVLFGLWHIRPTVDALRVNRLAPGRRRTAAAVAGAVAGTALAGALLAALRVRTGTVVAPALVHVASNSASTVAAAVAARLP